MMLWFMLGRWSRRPRRSGYWTAGRVFACLLLLGVAIVYWYVTLAIVVGFVLVGFVLEVSSRSKGSTGHRAVKQQPPPWPIDPMRAGRGGGKTTQAKWSNRR